MLVFVILITISMSIGDIVGIIICGIGFLIMMVYIEELEDIEQSSKIHELQKKFKQEGLWQSKEVTQMHTNRSKKERSKVD
jgi:hypothetical protein